MIRMLRCVALFALVCCVPSTSFAQAPPDWTMKVKPGEPLYITLLNGHQLEGLGGVVTGEGIAVATPDGVRTAKFEDIRRVDRRDGPWNGVLIGIAAGFATGLAMGLAEDCQKAFLSSLCEDVKRVVATAGALGGGLIGWGVDTMVKGRTTLFDSRGGPRLSFAASPKGVSGRVTLSW
ncbi:MAG TPA: hypothetical protein VNJ04_01570 [Gemmatimonadaceae bacterium]|nr:hypothetical protein [Gemmatimonadaceae bacterium]